MLQGTLWDEHVVILMGCGVPPSPILRMTDYRRYYVPGGSYFFTVALAERSSHLLIHEFALLRLACRATRQQLPFTLDAVVVLPDHLHCIITLPTGDADFSTRWKVFKATVSRHLPKTEHRSNSRIGKGERGIWQRRFWEHTLREERDFNNHLDYIHYNPVKHGLVPQVRDWPYSSFHRYVRLGHYPLHWAAPTDSAPEDIDLGIGRWVERKRNPSLTKPPPTKMGDGEWSSLT